MNKYMLLLLFIMASDVTAVDKIEPNKGTSIIKTEGESVKLSCSYDSDSEYVRLYWYRQYPNGDPQYLLREGARSNSVKHSSDPRFQSSTSRISTELIISSVSVSDSALYYCALRVTSEDWVRLAFSATDTLTFGKPITLKVVPKDVPATPPFLSILSPLKGDGRDICLAAGFFPEEKTMTLTVKGKDPVSLTTREPPLFKSTKTYYYAGFSEDDKVQTCEMDGQTADKTLDTADTTENPERVTEQTCPTSLSADALEFINTGDPKMNSMNLLVTGLRILLAKCVAVNALMTVKAFIF